MPEESLLPASLSGSSSCFRTSFWGAAPDAHKQVSWQLDHYCQSLWHICVSKYKAKHTLGNATQTM